MVAAEELIAEREFADALEIYDDVFEKFNFIFLRDCKVATQIALQAGNKQAALNFLRFGIKQGWELKDIKKNNHIQKHLDPADWKAIKTEYDSLRGLFEERLNPELRSLVKKMFKKDQWKALAALFTFTDKGQDKYAENKFAPHSEKQIEALQQILEDHGYPGEMLIGNDYWMSTVLSHHNSISHAYQNRDTLYNSLRPALLNAIGEGQMSPFEFAIVDNWYIAVKEKRGVSSYGFLGPALNSVTLEKANILRSRIGLRSVQLRNKLVNIQQETGIDFYLSGAPWVEGKININ